MPEITVYAKNNCTQCKMTQKVLKLNHIPFNVINLNDHPEAAEDIKNRSGFSSAPIVECRKEAQTDYWFGFRPERIKALSPLFASVAQAQ